MTEKKPSTYTGYTEARKAANAKYEAETVERISLVLPKGKKAVIKTHAEARGESVNGFINRSILETMERDNGACAPLSDPQTSAVSVSASQAYQQLTDTARKAAVEASEASGEAFPVFVERAIITQAKRDKLGRSLGKTTKEAGE